jgi:hypothetical protein
MEALEPRLLLAADMIGVDVIGYAPGGDPADNGKALPGGDGGTIDIRTGIQVTPGGGESGWLKTNITLASGTYNYEQVGSDYRTGHYPVITIDGDVTINCVTLFVAEIKAIFHPNSPPPQVHINAGPAIDYYGGQIDVRHAVGFDIEPGHVTKPDGSGMDGATVSFWTSQGGDIIGDVSSIVGWSPMVSADGGWGQYGGAGGDGGSVTLIANDATVKIDTVSADAGSSYTPSTAWCVGGDGGAGGQIVISGDTLAGYASPYISADGGNGDFGSHAALKHSASFAGGDGGAGGAIVVDVQHVVGTYEVYANGGDGGWGGDGLPGQKPGQAGTDGSDGGSGGTAGVVVGIVATEVLSGDGGAGGSGGTGAAGSYGGLTGPGGDGGDGGSGGNGGDSGGADATPGSGGALGWHGSGGGGTPAGSDGVNGDAGTAGEVGGGTPVSPPSVPVVTPSLTHVLTVGVIDVASKHGGDQNAHWLVTGFSALGCVRSAETVILKTSDLGNQAKIEAAIARAQDRVRVGDTFIYYHNGHGDFEASGNEVVPAPLDGDNHTTGNEDLFLYRSTPRLPAEQMTDDELRAAFNNATWNAVSKLFIMDVCYAGGYWGSTVNGDTGDLATLPKTALLAASHEEKVSWATRQANGYNAGDLGLATFWALKDLRATGPVDFQTLYDRTFVDGSPFFGTIGYIQDIGDNWNTPVTQGPFTLSPVTNTTAGFSLGLASDEYDLGTFGTVGVKKGVKLSVADADGTLVTFALTGPGTGMVHATAAGWELTVTGSNATSALTVTTKKSTSPRDDGKVTLLSIDVSGGAMKSITAATTNLAGDLDVDGTLATLVLGDVTGGTLSTGPRLAGDIKTVTTITLGAVRDENLIPGTPIKSLTVLNWADTDGTRDYINASSIAAITAKGRAANAKLGIAALAGDFDVDMTLTDAAAKATLGTVKIAGGVGGRIWKIAGAVTSITVARTVHDSWIRSMGSIGSLTLGAADGSDFLAGADFPAFQHHAPTQAQFQAAPLATIKAIKVTGWAVAKGQTPPRFVIDTNFSADTIGTVSLLNMDYASGAADWGIWALDAGTDKEITSVTALDNVSKLGWKWTPKLTPTIPAGNFAIDRI